MPEIPLSSSLEAKTVRYVSVLAVSLTLTLILLSCSGHPMSPPDVEGDITQSPSSEASFETGQTVLWGIYDVVIDPETMTATIEPDRHAMFAVNLVNILNQHTTSVNVNVVNSQTGAYGTVFHVDLTLIHPFPGNTGLNGYDVRGVFMGNGSGTLAYNADLTYPMFGFDQSLSGTGGDFSEGPDGYTRWFNMPEFSTGGMPIFSYTHGEKAPPDYSPTATLCPYLYYADGLGPTENAGDWLAANPGSNGVFSSGSANTRQYAVRFPTEATKLRFGYAIIANWEGTAPEYHPSNADEAVAAEADVTEDIYYEGPSNNGGDLIADFTLYSWKGLPTSIFIESTVLSSPYTLSAPEMVPTGSGDNYATWHIQISADDIQGAEGNEFWVIAEYAGSDYKNDFGTTNLTGDDPLSACFRFDLPVVTECGVFAWAVKAGGQLIDRGRAMTTLSDDSFVVTGEFSQAFCPNDYHDTPAVFGEGEANETTLIDPHLGDIFIARYYSDGTLAWAKRIGGDGYDIAADITTLSDDSIVITGSFGSNCYGNLESTVFGEGEPGETTLEATSPHGSFYVARYTPDGTLAWAKRAVGEYFYNSEYTQRGAAVTALSDDSVIATGVFGNTAIFGEGEPNETSISYHPYYWDIFIAKYNPDGTLAWAKRQGGTELEKPLGITTLSGDGFVISGLFGTQDVKPATFGEGEANETSLYTVGTDDIFIASYNSDGTLQWAERAGGILRDAGYDVTTLSDNSVVMCGSYGNGGDPGEAPATFGDGEPNETTLEHAGWDDIFVARYGTDGLLVWANRAAGESQEIAHDIVTLSGDMFAITGEFWEACVFGEGEANEFTLVPYPDTDPNFSYDDIFVAWYNADGTASCGNSAGGPSYDCSYALTGLSDDSVVAAGDIAGTYGATFGEGQDNEVTFYGQSYELFVARWYK